VNARPGIMLMFAAPELRTRAKYRYGCSTTMQLPRANACSCICGLTITQALSMPQLLLILGVTEKA